MSVNPLESSSIEKASEAKEKRYSKFTVSEKRAHVAAYLKGKQSQRAYCETHGLNVSSFKNWRSRYGCQPTKKFTPVITAGRSSPLHSATRIEIFKASCKIVVCEITDVETTLGLMKEMLLCNSR